MQAAPRDSSSEVAPVPSPAKPRGWWRRNWKRLILAVVVLAILGAGGGYFYKCGRILVSEPYHQAMADLRLSPQVKQLLGEPIKDTWFPVGTISSDDGEARFILKLRGPKTPDGKEPKAEATIVARLFSGKWGINSCEVTSDGQRLNLMEEILAREPSDVKPFDPTIVQPTLPKTDATPPPDVNIQIPDLPSDSNTK